MLLINKKYLEVDYDLKRWGLGIKFDFNSPATMKITLGCLDIVVWCR